MAEPFVCMRWEVHSSMSLLPWGTYIKALHRQISSILALSFHGLSLALLLSNKIAYAWHGVYPWISLLPVYLACCRSLRFHHVLGNFSWYSAVLPKERMFFFSFLFFLTISFSFPSPCSFLSYCTAAQYSQNSWTQEEWALLCLLLFTDQVAWLHRVFLNSGLCCYPLCVASGNVAILP